MQKVKNLKYKKFFTRPIGHFNNKIFLNCCLVDFSDRLNRRMEEDDIRKRKAVKECRLSQHFLQIIPKSCDFKPLLNLVDDRISEPFYLNPVVRQISGTERTFSCKLYRIEVIHCTHIRVALLRFFIVLFIMFPYKKSIVNLKEYRELLKVHMGTRGPDPPMDFFHDIPVYAL